MPLILFWKLWTSSWRPWINLDYILKVLDLGDVCSVLSLHVTRTIWQLQAPSFTKTFCSSPSMEFHAKICLTLLFYVEPSMTIFAVHAYQPSPNNNPSVNTALWGSECGVFLYLFRRRFCSSSKSKPSTFSYLPWPLLLIGLRP